MPYILPTDIKCGDSSTVSSSRILYVPNRRDHHETLHTHSPQPSGSSISWLSHSDRQSPYIPLTTHVIRQYDVQQASSHNKVDTSTYTDSQQHSHNFPLPATHELPSCDMPKATHNHTGLTPMEYFQAYGAYQYQQHNTYVPIDLQPNTRPSSYIVLQHYRYGASSTQATVAVADLNGPNEDSKGRMYHFPEKFYFPSVASDQEHDVAAIGTQFHKIGHPQCAHNATIAY